jgi:UDP-N-acetyl-D-galactosamine dehydrogenase
MLGYNPQVILAGRDLNDKMAEYVAEISIKLMVQKSIKINGSRILIMGLTFKENCPDLRNSGALNIIKKLNENGCVVDVYDPLATKEDIMDVYGKSPVETLVPKTYDCIIITVAHDKIKNIDFKFIKALGKDLNVICDLKQMYPKKLVDLQL